MMQAKALLREKLTQFQAQIYDLKRRLKEQETDSRVKETKLLTQIMDVLDLLEDAGGPELSAGVPAAPRSDKLLRGAQSRLERILRSRDLVPIECADNKAVMQYCKVIDARPAPGLTDETILAVVKRGYIDKRAGRVLRKAEVVTVRN